MGKSQVPQEQQPDYPGVDYPDGGHDVMAERQQENAAWGEAERNADRDRVVEIEREKMVVEIEREKMQANDRHTERQLRTIALGEAGSKLPLTQRLVEAKKIEDYLLYGEVPDDEG